MWFLAICIHKHMSIPKSREVIPCLKQNKRNNNNKERVDKVGMSQYLLKKQWSQLSFLEGIVSPETS